MTNNDKVREAFEKWAANSPANEWFYPNGDTKDGYVDGVTNVAFQVYAARQREVDKLREALEIEWSRSASYLKGFENIKKHNYSGLELAAWIENIEEIIYGARRNIQQALTQHQDKQQKD